MAALIFEPDIQQKLHILGGEAEDDVTSVPAAAPTPGGLRGAANMVYEAKRPGGTTKLQVASRNYMAKYPSSTAKLLEMLHLFSCY